MNCKNKNAKKGTPKAMGVGNTKKIGNSPQISEVTIKFQKTIPTVITQQPLRIWTSYFAPFINGSCLPCSEIW